MRRLLILAVTAAILPGGCSLQNEVSITPVFLMPSDVRQRGTSAVELERLGDYGRVLTFADSIAAKERPSAAELLALGNAQMMGGRLEEARRTLRRAVDLRLSFETLGNVAWALSQTEYLANNFEASLDWAEMARANGVGVREWHIEYLRAMSGRLVYELPSRHAALVDMQMGSPDIPRLMAAVNEEPRVTAVLDTGAVTSIVSESLARRTGIAPISAIEGTFIGLLGEPILVKFGVMDRLVLGDLEIRNVPVAIMADDKLQFFVYNKEPFRMDLLLGTNLLKEFRVELDFGREILTLQPLEPADRRPGPEQNLFMVGFRPLVQAAINRKGWFFFVVDTGSEITFLNEGRIRETPVRSSVRYHGAMLQGLGGAQISGEKVSDVEIAVDAWGGKFKNIPLYHSEQSAAYGILGQNFLKNFRVVIDFGAMRLDLFRARDEFQRSIIPELPTRDEPEEKELPREPRF
ncbi:MAG: retroviral-like aspartic protease family protein [Thermoanaerobaculia bacterium]